MNYINLTNARRIIDTIVRWKNHNPYTTETTRRSLITIQAHEMRLLREWIGQDSRKEGSHEVQ